MRTLADRQREREKAEADDRDLTSRTDRRREQSSREAALKRLARRLVGLKPHQLARLGLEEELRDAVDHARAIRSPNAQNRQIGVVRQHLRDMGAAAGALEQRLARVTGASSTPAELVRGAPPAQVTPPPGGPMADGLAPWLERLVGEGDAALEQLLAAHPALDRQQLRHQLRALVKARARASTADSERAKQRLRMTLRAALDAESAEARERR